MEFKKTTVNDVVNFREYFQNAIDRIIDLTVVGTFMWGDYFNQHFCIEDDILFLKYEIYNKEIAFNIPCCEKDKMELAYKKLCKYTRENNYNLTFKEVSQNALGQIGCFLSAYTTQTDDKWAEYVYSMDDLATLVGKKFNKKRNHLNKFFKLYGDKYKVEEISDKNLDKVMAFQQDFASRAERTGLENYENNRVWEVLKNYNTLKPEGLVLYVDNQVVAYTIGEVIQDTLFTHIEKADRDIDGAYNMINKEFAMFISKKYEHVKYVNRADDGGDEGLRRAKNSYNPIFLMHKYIIRVDIVNGCKG